jgi:hypothetical protein
MADSHGFRDLFTGVSVALLRNAASRTAACTILLFGDGSSCLSCPKGSPGWWAPFPHHNLEANIRY